MVDEFQDINELQYSLVLQHHAGGSRITVVGDYSQNIYAFRGSDVRYVDRIRADIPSMVTYNMTHNFRSTPEIIAVANCIYPKGI